MKRLKNRINAVDNLRGLSIIYMIFAHTGQYWIQRSDIWFYGFLFLIFEVIGANAFIFVAGIGLSLFYNLQKQKAQEEEITEMKHVHVNFTVRSSCILFLAFLTIIVGTTLSGELDIWVWYVLLTIAIARFICYPLLRIKPILRCVLGIIIFSLTDILRLLTSAENYSFFNYFLFNDLQSNPPFPFFGFFFIGTAIGDWLYNWFSVEETSRSYWNQHFIRNMMILGILFSGFGILIGLAPNNNEIARGNIWALNFHQKVYLESLPTFLVRTTMPWCFYSMGLELILLSFLIYLETTMKKCRTSNLEEINKDENRSISKMKYIQVFGQYSLTIYLSHYLLILVFYRSLNVITYLIAVIGFVLLIYAIFWSWANKANGKGTIEWLIRLLSKHVVSRIHSNQNHD